MASLKDRVVGTVDRLREEHPGFDHVLRLFQHYGAVNGNGQSGAVTYFGFLSVFPILALGVFVVGIVAVVYPEIRPQMVTEISALLPGVIGSKPGEIRLDTLGHYSGLTGLLGLAGVLYAGLGWLSALRAALQVMFVLPAGDAPNFVFGKLRDFVTLVVIGLILMVSVVLSGAVTGFSGKILDWVGLDTEALVPAVLLSVIGHVLAIGASTVLLLTMFNLLVVESHVPRRAMLGGALLGAVGFELLKSAANLLLRTTKGNPAFQSFGIALILLVWIYYFSRLVMYSAAWAYTSPLALAQRTAESMRAPGAAVSPAAPVSAETSRAAVEEAVEASRSAPATPSAPFPARPAHHGQSGQDRPSPWVAAAAGAAAAGAAMALVRGVRR